MGCPLRGAEGAPTSRRSPEPGWWCRNPALAKQASGSANHSPPRLESDVGLRGSPGGEVGWGPSSVLLCPGAAPSPALSPQARPSDERHRSLGVTRAPLHQSCRHTNKSTWPFRGWWGSRGNKLQGGFQVKSDGVAKQTCSQRSEAPCNPHRPRELSPLERLGHCLASTPTGSLQVARLPLLSPGTSQIRVLERDPLQSSGIMRKIKPIRREHAKIPYQCHVEGFLR